MLTSFHLVDIGETWTASSYEDEDRRLAVGRSVRVYALSAEVLSESRQAEIVGRPEGRRRNGCHTYLVRRTPQRPATRLGAVRARRRVSGRLRSATRCRGL